eukprot:ANDGO_03936.mRNA.1 Costars family protein At4g33640
MNAESVNTEIRHLQEWIAKLSTEKNASGKPVVAFGTLFDATQDVFEALAGTLKAAKQRKIISYDSPLLLKGAHDKVLITLEQESA